MWKLTKAADHTIPTLHGPGGLVFTDEEKANVLAENLKKVHHLTVNLESADDERRVHEIYNNIKQTDVNVDEINFVSPKEVKKAIKRTKSKKAPSLGNIQNIVLKNLTRKTLFQLTNKYNGCFRLSYFPSQWKIVNICSQNTR